MPPRIRARSRSGRARSRRDHLVCSPIGCGVDVVELGRFRRSLKRGGRAFLSRIYTDAEVRYAKAHRDPVPHLAARFAAKEAVMKALWQLDPTLVLGFRQIEVRNDRLGRPHAVLNHVNATVHISLSHADGVAVASAVAITAGAVRPVSRLSTVRAAMAWR